MPKLAIYKFLTFVIVSFDALNEPPHVHVIKTKSHRTRYAKIWLRSLQVSEQGDLTDKELNLALQLTKAYQRELIAQFEKAKAGKKVEPLKLKLK